MNHTAYKGKRDPINAPCNQPQRSEPRNQTYVHNYEHQSVEQPPTDGEQFTPRCPVCNMEITPTNHKVCPLVEGQPPATDNKPEWTAERCEAIVKRDWHFRNLANEINAALAAEREKLTALQREAWYQTDKLENELAAERDIKRGTYRALELEVSGYKKQLNAAHASMKEMSKIATEGLSAEILTKFCKLEVVDLSSLDKLKEEIKQPLVNALGRIRDEAAALVDARKLPNSVLYIEAPLRIKHMANAAIDEAMK